MPFTLFYIIEDAKGDKSTVNIEVPSTVVLTDIPDLVQTFAELVNDMVQGGIVSGGVTLEIDLTGVSTVAALAADVQEKAAYTFRGVNGFLKRLTIPTILESVFHLNSREVDTTLPSQAAFITAMTDGVTLTSTNVVQPCDSRGDDLDTLNDAREAWGRARR